MPKVQEYLPEQDAQGPVGQTSPMLEQVSAYGKGIETAGREMADAFSTLRQRQTQSETSDAYANVAETRAQYMQRVQSETADGTLDVEKVKQDYDDWTSKQYDQYSTPGGKDAFVRASARAGGSILTTAARGKAVVMGNEARDNLNTLSNSNSNMVQNDPSQFSDLRDSSVEAIQAQVSSGALSPAIARQTQEAMDIELAKGAARGYMQTDYGKIKAAVIASGGKIDPNADNLNSARLMLDKGGFDQFLNSDHKKALDQEIRQNQAAAQTAGVQAIQSRQAATDAQGEVFKSDAYEQIRLGKYDPAASVAAFRSGLITADEQLKLNHLSEQALKPETVSNPAVVNDLRKRILSPDNDPRHIADPMQFANMVGNGISHADFQDLKSTLGMVPANKVNSFNEAELMKVAKQRIGKDDPDSEYKLMLFGNEVQQAKQAALKAGTSVSPLFDPTNQQQFLGNQINKYIGSPADNLRAQANRLRGAATPTVSDTLPGVIPTPGSSAPVGPKPEDIAKMTAADLNKLDPSKMSGAQKAAARARVGALRGGK